jgi:hypothetical protein
LLQNRTVLFVANTRPDKDHRPNRQSKFVTKILDNNGESTRSLSIAHVRGSPLWYAASEQADNGTHRDASAQNEPEIEFDHRMAR